MRGKHWNILKVRLCHLQPGRYSKFAWTRPWAICPALSSGLDQRLSELPHSMNDCDSVSVTERGNHLLCLVYDTLLYIQSATLCHWGSPKMPCSAASTWKDIQSKPNPNTTNFLKSVLLLCRYQIMRKNNFVCHHMEDSVSALFHYLGYFEIRCLRTINLIWTLCGGKSRLLCRSDKKQLFTWRER